MTLTTEEYWSVHGKMETTRVAWDWAKYAFWWTVGALSGWMYWGPR
jgi:hypothetical protein